MKFNNGLRLILAATFLIGAATTNAQTAPDTQADDHADVWALIELQWAAEERGDDKSMNRLLTEDFSGWSNGSPAPRNKASTIMWDRFNKRVSKMVAHELYPLSIVVHDNVAVAHYLFTSADELKKKDGGIKSTNGRYTDILVRTDEGWKFLAWAGGSDD